MKPDFVLQFKPMLLPTLTGKIKLKKNIKLWGMFIVCKKQWYMEKLSCREEGRGRC